MSNNLYDNDEVTYIIPHNYSDNGKILGIIEKESVYLAAVWFIPVTVINFYLPFSLDVKLFTFILLVIPPTIFILIGVGGDTLLDFIKYVYRFYKNARIYYYEK